MLLRIIQHSARWLILCSLSHVTLAEPLQVMLQGQSASALAELVENNGGTVTHRLDVIDAVGALLTQQQLNATLTSPLVSRFIDDLSIDDTPEELPEPGATRCQGRGALELQKEPDAVIWRLYNKTDTNLPLTGLDLEWPALLGEAVAVSVDGRTVAESDIKSSEQGRFDAGFSAASGPRIGTPSALKVQFAAGKALALLADVPQRSFRFNAEFGGDCTEELIPGYADNFGDSYFTGVAGAEELHQNGVTGTGVTIAVLDSGLWEHESLTKNTAGEQRVVARYDAIADVEGDTVFDESGHGTHLTSAMASSAAIIRNDRATGAFKGIAPDADLAVVKAFNRQGRGDFLDIVRGIQWVIAHRQIYGIKVLNLSFAAMPRWPYWLDPINQALMRAWAEGITVIAAAGNEGPDPMTVGSPGNLPYIITVGAVTDSWTPESRGDDYVPDFSSRGPTPSAHIKPDIVAPGGHIIGITRPGSTLTEEHPEYMLTEEYLVMTGTSQASAIVSGIVALLLQLQPDLTPDDVKCKLVTSAELAINSDGLLAYSPFQQGNGYVNAKRAVLLGQTGCGNTDLNLEEDIKGIRHFQGPAIVDSDGNVSLPGLDSMVSPEPAAKGYSESRRWGVKDHIERPSRARGGDEPAGNAIFNWKEQYREEKAAIERLTDQGRQ